MATQLNNGMCRCCASEGTFKDVKNTYQWMGEEEIYSEMLRECFDIALSIAEDDGGICEVCITQLRNASNFKKQVLHTEEHFKKRLEDRTFKTDIVKVEISREDDNDSDNDHDNDNENDNASDFSEYEVPIKQEAKEEEPPKPKKRAAKASPKPAKKAKAEDGETSTKREASEQPQKVTKASLRRARRAALEEKRKQKHNLIKILMFSNANPIKCKDMTGIHCAYCPKSRIQSSELKKHFADAHRDEDFLKTRMVTFSKNVVKLDVTNLRCDVCSSEVDTLEDMLNHLKMQHDVDAHTDVVNPFLPFKFDNDHMRCAICNNEYPVFKNLREHMNSHFRNFVCDICNAGYVNHEMLYRHKLRHGGSETKCNHCEKSFKSEPHMRRHMQTVHLKIKKNKCNFCDERFNEFNQKLMHIKNVHSLNMNLKCSSCDKSFPTTRSRSDHIRNFHLLERNHKCKICNTGFYTSISLKSHMITHNVVKWYKCPYCSNSYPRKGTLHAHIKTHLNKKEYNCDFCSSSFVQNMGLKRHLLTKHANLFEDY